MYNKLALGRDTDKIFRVNASLQETCWKHKTEKINQNWVVGLINDHCTHRCFVFPKNSNSLGVNLSDELSKRRKSKRQWRIKLNATMYINGFIRANRVTVWDQKCWGGFWGDCRNLVSLHRPCPAINPAWQLYSAMLDWSMREEGTFFSNLFYLHFFSFFFSLPCWTSFLEHLLSACLSCAWQQCTCVLWCPEPYITCPQETWPHVYRDRISRHIPISLFWCFYHSVMGNHSLQPKQTLSQWP